MDEAQRTHDGYGNLKGRDSSEEEELRSKLKCNLSLRKSVGGCGFH